MRCPVCSHENTKVIDSRQTDDMTSIRRRRECESCGARFTTFERIELSPLMVIKKDNTREQFDRDKLLDGLMKSCEKRPISFKEVEKCVDNVEKKLRNKNTNEVSSTEIGEVVMEELMQLDQVAYVRFASVYREFTDINQLMDALKHLEKGEKGE
ncbi:MULTISPECIES: transcriptional regulator NrdR [Nosocomiicoccus]|uniref:Transcriptional repressor NrdR n=1 Tax=Nosocomiicoccus massiliensis TaxID=1232430 RepID=A0AAF0YJA2_9STAP|nr:MULTISPECIES: transcriptional regulator NrdR [Nosocomiicoccus]MDK6863151.1 transcriptional regulator NrdR [Nosocomiicoccus ampullae]OFL46233.1 transcriptional regulator NrdR [Nosocomiicoccus sp. HMSC067E10]OFO55767.1 transcriptional regulator NrdR [Nosocomiicoccus sp. HMSC059G07]OFS63886.1 transcriptional regulator NrdR [Nosocomiicoccus sp. HMSC09A07]WOS96648.1 transcriptional regulator NrdR [Nosocomiicoccus massiliensis]